MYKKNNNTLLKNLFKRLHSNMNYGNRAWLIDTMCQYSWYIEPLSMVFKQKLLTFERYTRWSYDLVTPIHTGWSMTWWPQHIPGDLWPGDPNTYQVTLWPDDLNAYQVTPIHTRWPNDLMTSTHTRWSMTWWPQYIPRELVT